MRLKGLSTQAGRLVLLIAFQAICTTFFVFDITNDMKALHISSLTDLAFLPELGATLGLVLGMVFELRVLKQMMHRQVQLEQSMSVAAGALASVIEDYYHQWGLTAAERDVAGFTIKGYSIAEIAVLRDSAPGTVKTHLNAIYRKGGVAGRAQLVSLLVEDLLRAPLLETRRGGVRNAA